MKNVMKAAHKMTKEIIKEYPEVDYKAQLGLCISYLMEEENKEEKVTLEVIENVAKQYCNGYSNGWYATVSLNNWVKGEFNRTYIEIKEYRNGSLRSTKKCGYWDNIKEEYIAFDRSCKVLNLLAA